jgi:CheY-like chemotaxis protein
MGSTPTTKNCQCRCILVVEDEAEIRLSLKEALEWEGYRVISAANGREALERLLRMNDPNAPCVILLDLMMPVMNGWEFAAALKADDVRADIPIVVVTAFPDEAQQKTVGEEEVVSKPVDLDRLLVLVSRYCGTPTHQPHQHDRSV